jgi:3-hydroxyisobutyrate dehydrogenase-like beta-hydroxyacid dehydrogenase
MKTITPDERLLGFIGIGRMGSRIARRLLDHGYKLVVYNRNRAAAEALVEHGASAADDVATLATRADVILSCLTNDEAVLSVYNGAQGVFAHVRPDSAIIEMSTVLPRTSRELHKRSLAARVAFLDTTISGSTPAAEQGALTLFCGGDEELFHCAQPVFSATARQNFYLGPSGSGATMKLVVNTLLGVGMQAIAEAVALGEKAGLDRHRLLDVLAQTAVVAPAHAGKLQRADAHEYSPQFALSLMNKDFHLILETAAEARVPMPATAAAFQMNAAEFSSSGNDEDFSAVIPLMEKLAHLN